jgi:hypothetical protein
MFKSYSQCGQDLYAFEKTNNKKDGYYIEIGAFHATDISNTKMLEELGWRGISFEGSQDLRHHWHPIRSNNLITCDATKFDFKKCFDGNNVPNVIDYLSLDIDEGTLDCLKRLPLQDYIFKVITIEHDEYSQGPVKKNAMREILYSYGYTLDRPDVANGGNIYEDWWIR